VAVREIRRKFSSLRQTLRRYRQRYLPDAETRRYREWIERRVQHRTQFFSAPVPSGLLSILTAVWDGSPVQYLQALAKSIEAQNAEGACEWVILDNGCARLEVRDYLNHLNERPWIKVHRSEENLGILRGLRFCLERASNRYVLPVDADDQLYPDALKIVAAYIEKSGYPPILYTDEDKISNTGVSQPYFKPDWDPVLLGNLAYIAHLGVIDREEALRLGAYSEGATEGSPDWDLFLRFAAAGHSAVHIPEVVYNWRMHATSTAEDAQSKSYVMRSQQAVLAGFIKAKGLAEQFSVENSRFFPGAPHWHLARRQTNPKAMTCVLIRRDAEEPQPRAKIHGSYNAVAVIPVDVRSDPRSLAPLARDVARRDELLFFLREGLEIDNADWGWEALGVFELFPDSVMIGGLIRNEAGEILEAGLQLGYGGACGSPDQGRKRTDPGYFGQAWKQRSVSAVSVQCAVVKPTFLLQALQQLPAGASLPLLGAWLGAFAFRKGARVVYSPFLGGVSKTAWDRFTAADEENLFTSLNRDILPDRRYYPQPFSLGAGYILDTDELTAS
jgi:glycosyltransferase involved in cell wall biosynthesis